MSYEKNKNDESTGVDVLCESPDEVKHSKEVGNRAFWEEKWQRSPDAQPGWDLAGPHPLFDDLLKLVSEVDVLKSDSKIFVPGCGRCHNGAKFAKLGCQVTAMDIVPEAIKRAEELYGKVGNIEFRLGSVFEVAEEEQQIYDLVFDRAMLCALDRPRRKGFVRAMAARLRPGGVFASIGFAKTGDEVGGPPFAIGIEEITGLFQSEFTLVAAEHRTNGASDSVIKEELLNVWRKK